MAGAPKIGVQESWNEDLTPQVGGNLSRLSRSGSGETTHALLLQSRLKPTARIEEDFHGWLLDQVAALRARDYGALDWEHLAEEIESMAVRERREMKDRLI